LFLAEAAVDTQVVATAAEAAEAEAFDSFQEKHYPAVLQL
jgi:hypothetical protein